jgi:hypothetical protein
MWYNEAWHLKHPPKPSRRDSIRLPYVAVLSADFSTVLLWRMRFSTSLLVGDAEGTHSRSRFALGTIGV